MRTIIFLPVFFILSFLCAQAQTPLQEARDISRLLLEIYPGISVAVGVNNEVIWHEGFGFADIDSKKLVTDSTSFRYYSLSKSITGMALARLVAEGKLDIEKPVTKYMPELPAHYQAVRVANLISHSAGVRHYKKGEWMKISSDNCHTAREALNVFMNDPLEFEPGTKYSYSSFGYVLLSALVESITHMSFPEYIQTAILGPAGITGFGIDRSDIKNESRYYDKWDMKKVKGKESPEVNNTCKFGGGGLVGTATALVNLHMAMLDGKIVTGDALKMYYTSFKQNDGKSLNYGFGIGVAEKDDIKYFSHTGSAVGANSAMIIYPEKKVVIVILGNLEDSAMNSIIGEMGRLFFE